MKTTFTPGPWKVVSGAVETEKGVPIAYMDREPENGTLPVERDNNARLIAAAPELFKAALFVVNDAPEGEDARLTVDGYNLLCAAIAKAKGE